jgi:uncharacterized membrane protein
VKGADRALAVGGCCVALGALVPVALFQGEVMDSLPDPPGGVWASERITLSKSAHPLGIPDSYLGLASYGTTLGLVLMADRNRTARTLLGAKLVADAGLATFNMVRQVVSFRKLCSWCTGTALATGLVVYGGRAAIVHLARAARRSM